MTAIEIMRTRVKKLADRIDNFSLRERGLIFFSVMTVLYVVADNFILGAMFDQQDRLRGQLTAKHKQIIALDKQIQQTLVGPGGKAGAQKQVRLQQLRMQLTGLRSNVEEITTDLVSPKDMARLVEDILIKNRRLKVIEIANIPPHPIATVDKTVSKKRKVQASAPVIFKHGMRVRLQGRYQDIVSYLQALEQLPWKVFWGQVTLDSQVYPISQLTLVLYTLSLSEGWIGT